MRILLAVAVVLSLTACGSRSKLVPARGAELPVAPYGAKERLDSEQLLTPGVQAVPERSVEKRTRSEERAADPFNFPPAR